MPPPQVPPETSGCMPTSNFGASVSDPVPVALTFAVVSVLVALALSPEVEEVEAEVVGVSLVVGGTVVGVLGLVGLCVVPSLSLAPLFPLSPQASRGRHMQVRSEAVKTRMEWTLHCSRASASLRRSQEPGRSLVITE